MNMSLHKQKGATLVEMAIVLVLFLMIIFAVMEFSIAIVRSAQLTEAVRFGARHAIVNDPLGTLPSCPDGTSAPVDASVEMRNGMADIAPIINDQAAINVTVKYTCPDNVYIGNGLYLVTVAVSGAKYDLIFPSLLGLGVAIDLQTFKSTRLSEDLHTGG